MKPSLPRAALGILVFLCVKHAAHGAATSDMYEFAASIEGWIVNFGGAGVLGHSGGQNGTGLSAVGGDLVFTLNPSGDPAISTGFASRNLSRWDQVFVEVTVSTNVSAHIFYQAGGGYSFFEGSTVLLPAGVPTRVSASLLLPGADRSQIQAYGIWFFANGSPTSVQIHRAGVIGSGLPSVFSAPDPLGTEYWIVRGGAVSGNADPYGDPPPGNGLTRVSSGAGDGVLRFAVPAGATAEVSSDISREDFDLSSVDELEFALSSTQALSVMPFVERTSALLRTIGMATPVTGGGGMQGVSLDLTGLPSRTDTRAFGWIVVNSSGQEATVDLDHVREATPLPALEISNVQEVGDPVENFARFEARFDLNRTFLGSAPFNPDVIDASAVITPPSGESVVAPAFYTQDYTISNPAWETYTPVGSPYWRVRYTPSQVGVHSYVLRARDQTGETQTGAFSFESIASGRKGFVRIHPENPLALVHDNGSLYFPLGHNIAFGDGIPANQNGTAYYATLFSGLAASHGNWSRVWMTEFERSALEWSTGHFSGFYSGVGVYSLEAAFRVEKILELAEQHGLAVQLVLNDHGQFSSWVNARWNENPYNQARGGPVADGNPEQFFTDPTARELHKRRLRYVIARYGAYPSLLAWELFNEVQFTCRSSANWFTSEAIRNAIRDWHAEMAVYIKQLDPFRHPVTTSSDTSNFSLLWNLGDIDLPQIHDYTAPASQRDILIRSQVTALQGAHGKAVIVGEFGTDPSGDDECNFNPTTYGGSAANRDHLIQGTLLHNTLWSAALSRSAAASWWWGCYLEPDPSRSRTGASFPQHALHYPPLAAFLDGFPMADPALANSSVVAPLSVVAFGLASDNKALVWVRDAQNAFDSGVGPGNLAPQRTLAGISITLPELADDRYRVEFFDPWSGAVVGDWDGAASGGGGLTFTLPDFQRDLALKVTRNETSVSHWQIY